MEMDLLGQALFKLSDNLRSAILGFPYKGSVTNIDDFLGAGKQRTAYLLLNEPDLCVRISTDIERGKTFDTVNIGGYQRSVNIHHSASGDFITFQTGVSDREGILGSRSPSSSLDAYVDGEKYLSAAVETHQAISSLAIESGFSYCRTYSIAYTADQRSFTIDGYGTSLQARLLVVQDESAVPALSQQNALIVPSPQLYRALVSLLQPI